MPTCNHGPLDQSIAEEFLTRFRVGCSDEKSPTYYPKTALLDDAKGSFDCKTVQAALFHRTRCAVRAAEKRSDPTQMETIMFVKSTLPALVLAVALPFSGVAFAGDDQLAKLAGVEPGIYTTAELIQIDQARKSNDDEALKYYLSGENRVSRASSTSSTSEGVAQMAAIAGVSPNGHTAASLQLLLDAQSENDPARAAYIQARAEGEISDIPPNSTSAGKEQLAALVGKDASTTSYRELIEAADQY